MSERFIKFIPGKRARALLKRSPNAYLLLSIIASSANHTAELWEGLGPGECYLGDWKAYGMTEREYRTAKKILHDFLLIETVDTNRTRGKSTTGATTIGTKVRLIDSSIWDLNLESKDDRGDDRKTTERRPSDDDQEYKEHKEHKEKEAKASKKIRSAHVASADASRLADLLLKKILERDPLFKPKNFNAWLKSVDKLLKDGRSPEQVEKVILWATTHQFWSKNILSGSSLADKFTTLLLGMQEIPGAPNSDFKDLVLKRFKHGEFYNNAECFIDSQGIAFQRNMNHQQLRFSEKGFKDQFLSMIRKFDIKVEL